MTIYFLAAYYLDILNRKFPLKKPFRPENSDCVECVTFSLPRIKFNLSSGIFDRRTATGSKTSSLFICLSLTPQYICIDKCHYSYRDDLPENLPKNHCPRMQKVHFRWPFETPYLNQKRHAIFKRTDKIHHCGFVVYFRT